MNLQSLDAEIDELVDRIDQAPASIWIARRSREEIYDDARRAVDRQRAGEVLPLAGRTFAVKDNIDVAGMRTTAGHPSYQRHPERNAVVVQRLIDAGAILIGKTNMDQFATGLVGTRSPFGVVASAHHPSRISGGSSSGSAAAVGHGLVDFSLGTDTAGSGRVPAAFNRIIGVKPTLGLIPLAGVVPACPSYDSVSIFARNLELSSQVLAVAVGPCDEDPASRGWSAEAPLGGPERAVIAVPEPEQLSSLGVLQREAFDKVAARLECAGHHVRTINIELFLRTARLLYDGGLVAERAWSYGEFVKENPEEVDQSVARVATGAMGVSGVGVIDAQQHVRAAKAEAKTILDGIDAMLLPTAPWHPLITDVQADPMAVNSEMGTFTNFMNLMDMAGVSVPAASLSDQGEFGVTFVVPAFHDQLAVDLAADLWNEPYPDLGVPGIDIAVFGAHMSGEPLNGELLSRGARHCGDITTADKYRMLLITGETDRPGLILSDTGRELPGELWRLSPAAFADFATTLSEPLALGKVQLSDERLVLGFVASPTGTEQDITEFAGWRNYLTTSALASQH